VGDVAVSSLAGVRLALAGSEDPRVGRTRAAIFAAVEMLMSRDASAITVADVVAEAGVSRTSFYSHFSGFDDLAGQVVQRAYQDFGRQIIAAGIEHPRDYAESVQAAFRGLIDHHVAHRPLYLGVLALPLSSEVYRQTAQALAAELVPALARNTAKPAQLSVASAAVFISSAVVGFLDAWLAGRLDVEDDELTTQIMALLPAWFAPSSLP